MAYRKDLTGLKKGWLIVESYAGEQQRGKRKISIWNCLCTRCGKHCIKTTDSLTKNNCSSCGCYRVDFGRKIGKTNHIDLSGKTIGEWYVDYRTDDYINSSGIHAVKYSCICSCGTRKDVLAASLINGESLSCGHNRQEMLANLLRKDITGQQIYELHVDYLIQNSKPPRYHCTCSCGVEKDILGTSLRAGQISCGHSRASKGEHDVKSVLEKEKIKHKFDCTLQELTEYCNKHLRVDFQLFDVNNNLVCVIEYQGEQHYVDNENGFKDFGKQQREETDAIKRSFFNINKIPFYEIKYTQDAKEITYAILYKHHLIHDNTVPSLQETA